MCRHDVHGFVLWFYLNFYSGDICLGFLPAHTPELETTKRLWPIIDEGLCCTKKRN